MAKAYPQAAYMNAKGVVNGMCFAQQSRKGVQKMRQAGVHGKIVAAHNSCAAQYSVPTSRTVVACSILL